MKIAFEDWLSTQELSDDAQGCFDEAFLCYRVKAYRAALLFSYLGFLTVLKRRLLAARPPQGVGEKEWDACHKRLKQEDGWEKAVFTEVERQNGQPYFSLNDDIRQEVRYWRDRRNDCAHFKRRVIETAQVEGLWSFIRSRLDLFAVVGSGEDLLTRVVDHYDPTRTAPSRPADPLVAALSSSNLPDGYSKFFADLSARLAGPDKGRVADTAEIQFLDACLRLGSPPLRSDAGEHVLKADDRAERFLVRHPEHAGLLFGKLPRVRSLWASAFKHTKNQDHFPLLAALLRDGLIPADEAAECFTVVLKLAPTFAPAGADLATLKQHGFVEALEEVACREMRQFAWGNPCVKLVLLLLEDRPISDPLAKAIYDAFNARYYPTELRNALQTYFTDNAAKRTEYQASRAGVEGWPAYPASIPALRPPELPHPPPGF